MNDIYSPPKADVSVDRSAPELSYLTSLGGFVLSLLGVNVLIVGLSAIYRLQVAVDASANSLIALGILRFAIHVAWIIAWPMFCRKRRWPNLYRGARWHRLLFILVVSASAVVLTGLGLFA
mgnify:CR=1 FL=1